MVTEVRSDSIDLEWTDNDDNGTFFRIERSENGGAPVSLDLPATPGMVQIHHTDDVGIKENTTYEYQVFAFNLENHSQGSNKASATTPGIAFEAAFDDNQGGWADDCMVQRINAAGNLFNSGTKVRITLRGSTNIALIIERAYISQAASAPGGGPDAEVDSLAGDRAQVTFGGNEGVTLAAGASVLSDEIAYPFVHIKDLIIAFDIGNQGGARRGPKVGCQAYRSVNTDQAATADRSNFTAEIADTVYLVEKIEVFS